MAQSVIFGSPSRPLLGFYHAAEGAPSRALAIVLCNPVGYQAMAAHRTYRHLADRLAARGFSALRFDYDGTGDSAGRSDGPGRLGAWIASIDAAIDEVLARSGAARVGLFGVSLGATLALLAAERRTGVDCLIPWAPVVSGRAYVRELRAFRLARSGADAAPQPADGSEVIRGHLFTRELLTDLSAIDLFAGGNRLAKRVFVLPRADPASREEVHLMNRLEGSGANVRMASKTGYAKMMRDDPYESAVPFATLDAIVAWVGEEHFPEARTGAPRDDASSVMMVTGPDGKSALRETPVAFGEGKRLFGIYSSPSAPARADRPVLCFLNAGATHHVGPHRMFVEFARDFASRGYPSFRFDVAGLGDSRAVPGDPENRLYARESIADVKTAMTMLARQQNANRFVLVGLCSGAYLAYHAALGDRDVAGQVLINPFAFEMEGHSLDPAALKPVVSNRSYARSLLNHRTWLRAARGDVDLPRIAKILRGRIQAYAGFELAHAMAIIRGQPAPGAEVERQFRALCDRGAASLLVVNVDEGGLDLVARHLGRNARKMRGHPKFSLRIVEGADHTFGAGTSKHTLHEILWSYLDAHFP
jgi:alpha-beta hydrolase superfamily lysophospholipase